MPEASRFACVNTQPGCDASNMNDEELMPNEIEYSDDEQEAEVCNFFVSHKVCSV